jgi:hypothetical protein
MRSEPVVRTSVFVVSRYQVRSAEECVLRDLNITLTWNVELKLKRGNLKSLLEETELMHGSNVGKATSRRKTWKPL